MPRGGLVLPRRPAIQALAIAEVMGCPQSTVRGHVFKALAALRVELGKPLAAVAPSREGH